MLKKMLLTKEEVKERLEDGDTYANIARDAGVSRQRVYQLAKQLGLRSKQYRRKYTRQTFLDFGWGGIDKLCALYDTNRSTIIKHLKKFEIEPEPVYCNCGKEIAVLKKRCRYCTWKNNTLKYLYGISLHDYNKMLEIHDNRCALCGNEETALDKTGTKIKKLGVYQYNDTIVLMCNRCQSVVKTNLPQTSKFSREAIDRFYEMRDKVDTYIRKERI